MARKFKVLSTRKEVDLISYIKEYMSLHQGVQILIGCDSQNKGRDTVYALVVGLYTPGKGAHVIFEKTTEPRGKAVTKENKDFSPEIARLLNEVWMSVGIAEEMRVAGLPKPAYIDIDISNDKKYKSNAVLSSALGLVTGMGYNVRHKGQFPMMTYMSDHLVK
jgi:predicted RNase H-related nuclease YkuK (DUF458 family)